MPLELFGPGLVSARATIRRPGGGESHWTAVQGDGWAYFPYLPLGEGLNDVTVRFEQIGTTGGTLSRKIDYQPAGALLQADPDPLTISVPKTELATGEKLPVTIRGGTSSVQSSLLQLSLSAGTWEDLPATPITLLEFATPGRYLLQARQQSAGQILVSRPQLITVRGQGMVVMRGAELGAHPSARAVRSEGVVAFFGPGVQHLIDPRTGRGSLYDATLPEPVSDVAYSSTSNSYYCYSPGSGSLRRFEIRDAAGKRSFQQDPGFGTNGVTALPKDPDSLLIVWSRQQLTQFERIVHFARGTKRLSILDAQGRVLQQAGYAPDITRVERIPEVMVLCIDESAGKQWTLNPLVPSQLFYPLDLGAILPDAAELRDVHAVQSAFTGATPESFRVIARLAKRSVHLEMRGETVVRNEALSGSIDNCLGTYAIGADAVGVICADSNGLLDLAVVAASTGGSDPYSAFLDALQRARSGPAELSASCTDQWLRELEAEPGGLAAWAQRLAGLEPVAAVEQRRRGLCRAYAQGASGLERFELRFTAGSWRIAR